MHDYMCLGVHKHVEIHTSMYMYEEDKGKPQYHLREASTPPLWALVGLGLTS